MDACSCHNFISNFIKKEIEIKKITRDFKLSNQIFWMAKLVEKDTTDPNE